MALLTREVLFDLDGGASDWALWGSSRESFVTKYWKRFTAIMAEEGESHEDEILRHVLKTKRNTPEGKDRFKVYDSEGDLLYNDTEWGSGVEFVWYDETTNVLVLNLLIENAQPLAGTLLEDDNEQYVGLLVIPLYRGTGSTNAPIPGFVVIPTDDDKIYDEPNLTVGLQRRIIALLLK